MKKFVYKYNLEILSVFLVIEFILTMLYRDILSPGRVITGVFALLIMLHEWEELRCPGGFFELMGGKMGIDMSKVDMGKCHLPTKILILVFATVPMIFDQVMVIVFVPIMLMFFELFIHIMGIFLHKMKKPYTPGLVTAALMGTWGIGSTCWLFSNGLAHVTDLLLAIPIFFLCFFTMGISIVKLIGVDMNRIRENMMGKRKSK